MHIDVITLFLISRVTKYNSLRSFSSNSSVAYLLADYLNAVVIPVWNVAKEPKKQMSLRERLLASKNRSIEKKKSTRDLLTFTISTLVIQKEK